MNPFPLPESLLAQLRGYEARLRQVETWAAVAGGVAGLCGGYLLLFALDRVFDTPHWLRALLLLGGGGLAARCAQLWARHWWWQRRDAAELARLLQRHFRTLGDRLQGIVELTRMPALPENISPALLRAAIRQVAAEAGRFDFPQAVPARPVHRRAMLAAALAVVAMAPFLFVPKAASNALRRWLAPWSDVARYTFADLEALPAELFVPRGEPFELICGVKADSPWKPRAATARLGGQEPQQARLEQRQAHFHFTGQVQDARLAIRLGDATREIAVHPLNRPEITQLSAQVTPPEYLGQPAARVRVPGGAAQFLAGSRVRFTGKTSRPLREAALKMAEGEPAAEVRGAEFITPAEPVEALNGQAAFRWADVHGLTPAQPYKVQISTLADAEPRVELEGLEPEEAILPDEVVQLSLKATDDYGVKEAWLGWAARPLHQPKESAVPGEARHAAGGPQQKELAAPASFSATALKIPADSVVELAAYAVDYLPGRKPVESWKRTLYILSPAKHAERVQQRMEQVLRQLDDRIRDEERQVEETKSLAQNTPDLAKEKTGEQIQRVEAGERANASQVQKLTEEMQAVMKDALRNAQIPEKTVADWQQIAGALEQRASPPMAEAAQALQKAGAEPASREPQMAAAEQQQEQALEAMRRAASQISTANQNLFARNFYHRLRATASAERGISDGLKKLARQTVGLRPEEIAEADKAAFLEVAGRQDGAARDVTGIATDLAAFAKRVPNEKYAAVSKEMQDKHAAVDLAELSGFVRSNLGLKSVGRARLWSAQLDAWAAMLQDESNGQGGNGGGGEMDPELMEFLVSMVRAAVLQDAVREQTAALDKGQETNPQLAAESSKLAGQQDGVDAALEAMLAKILWSEFKPSLLPRLPAALGGPKPSKFAPFQPLLEQGEKLAREAAGDLRGTRIDEDLLATQAAIIELLVPPEKKSGDQSSPAQQMMRKMMAQAARGRSGGGNNAKSSGGEAGESAPGAAGAARNAARAVDKAGAAGAANEWPEEYRDQLQAYFQRVEGGN